MLPELLQYVPVHYLNNIIYGLRIYWFYQIFSLLFFTTLIFYYFRLNQVNIKNVIAVACMAIAYFVILKISDYVSTQLVNFNVGEVSRFNRPNVLYIFGRDILKYIVNILILILIFIPRVFLCKKPKIAFHVTKKNNSLIYNSLYIIIMMFFILTSAVLIVYSACVLTNDPTLFQNILLLSYQLSEYLFIGAFVAIIFLFLTVYRTVKFQDESLKLGRLMISCLINTLIFWVIFFLVISLIYLTSTMSQDLADEDKIVLIGGLIFFIPISQMINRLMFKKKSEKNITEKMEKSDLTQ